MFPLFWYFDILDILTFSTFWHFQHFDIFDIFTFWHFTKQFDDVTIMKPFFASLSQLKSSFVVALVLASKALESRLNAPSTGNAKINICEVCKCLEYGSTIVRCPFKRLDRKTLASLDYPDEMHRLVTPFHCFWHNPLGLWGHTQTHGSL